MAFFPKIAERTVFILAPFRFVIQRRRRRKMEKLWRTETAKIKKT